MVIASLERWFNQQWQTRSCWQILLQPLSLLYRFALFFRHMAYRLNWLHRTTFPIPVLVVGNLVIGGSGKTPLTIWIANQLRAKGWHPGIISRGYGGQNRVPHAIQPNTDVAISGDESLLMARHTDVPVYTARLRSAAAKALLVAHPDVDILISDDGLQHTALARQIEIVVIDATRGFGNQRLLPAGPLREPLRRLQSADIIIVNQTGPLHASLRKLPAHHTLTLQPDTLYALTAPRQRVTPDFFIGKTLHAVAGIGHPQRFFNQLSAAGLSFTAHAFPDHHAFQAGELNFHGDIIMTEKDAVKCEAFATDAMWVWPVQAQPDNDFLPHLLTRLDAHHGRQTA